MQLSKRLQTVAHLAVLLLILDVTMDLPLYIW
jgi:hypothetical protein